MQLIAPGPAVLLASALAARPAARGGRPFCMGGGFGAAARDTFKYSGKVRPGKQSPKRSVPKSISKPDYWKDGQPKARGPMLPWQIQKKSEADIEGMRAAGRIAREVLDLAGAAVAPGVTTEAIDALVHEAAVSRGAYPSPLNYHGFPKSCCTSVNEVICHGIPDSSKLRDGTARPTPRRHSFPLLFSRPAAAGTPLHRQVTSSTSTSHATTEATTGTAPRHSWLARWTRRAGSWSR